MHQRMLGLATRCCTCMQPWTEAGARDRSEDLRDSVYAKRQDHAKEAQTFTRVLEHTQQTVSDGQNGNNDVVWAAKQNT